ncbi:MAG: NAD(P)/FAD-dependent oxidoreductase [Actinomycetota bacterium]
MNAYQAIVIGGGHNGLVAAAYLAKAGARVVVCEARHKTGGAAATDRPWTDHPEFAVTTLSYVMSLMPDRIIRDLRMAEHGYRVHPVGPYVVPLPDGRVLIEYDDPKRNYEEFAKISKPDADALERWDAWIGGLAAVLGPLLMTTPPRVGSKRPGDLLELLRLAWRFRGLDVRTIGDVTRLMTMSVADLLERFFSSDEIKAAMSINGLIGTWAGPLEPGTGYVMAHHSIGDVGDGTLGSWGVLEGGMGAVAAVLERSARAFGAEVRTNAKVQKILVRDGRAEGVVLEGGEELRAQVVVSACHPQITFLRQLDRSELPSEFVHDIEHWSSRSGVVKINLAVSELPTLAADPDWKDYSGGFEIAPSLAQLERSFEEARAGTAATFPFSDGVIPTVLDPSLAPPGAHVVSLFTQWVPHTWSLEPHREELDAYADRVIQAYDDVAPGFRASVIARQVIGPYDMENEWGLIGGNIFHGELSADQLFHMRPAPGYADYRTPIAGLYQCSSATHAGGGVCGIPAYNCVREIREDRRRRRKGR